MSDPPSTSRRTAAPSAGTARQSRQQVKAPSKKGTAAKGAVIVIDDSPPNTQQPASLAQAARESLATNLAMPLSQLHARTTQLQAERQSIKSRKGQREAAKPQSQPQHAQASSAAARGAEQQRSSKQHDAAELPARTAPPEPAERDCRNSGWVFKSDVDKSAEACASPVRGAAADSPGSVYASPSCSLPEEDNDATFAGQRLESLKKQPNSFIAFSSATEDADEAANLAAANSHEPRDKVVQDAFGAAHVQGSSIHSDLVGAYDAKQWNDQSLGNADFSDSWGYGGNTLSISCVQYLFNFSKRTGARIWQLE